MSKTKAIALYVALVTFGLWLGYHLPDNTPRPVWTGSKWACPVGYDVAASEFEAAQGKDAAHCIK